MIRYLQQSWMVLALALVCGAALAGVSSWLQPIIAANEADARAQAALLVVPGAQRAQEVTDIPGVKAFRVFAADGTLAGWAVMGESTGYSGTIQVVFGLDPQATRITGMKVLGNTETPGLGNKIADEAPGSFRDGFVDKSTATPLQASKSPVAPNEVQAVTGATISSNAVCQAIDAQLQAGLREKLLKAGMSPSTAP